MARMQLLGREALALADRRYQDLLDKYHALKLQGAAEPVAPIAPAPRPIDPIMQEIAAQCGGNTAKRGLMLRQVARDRKAGLDDEVILSRIRQGSQESDG